MEFQIMTITRKQQKPSIKQRRSKWAGSLTSTNRENSMFRQDPLDTIGYIQAQKLQFLIVGWYQSQTIQASRQSLDTGQDFTVRTVDKRSGESTGADGTKAETGTEWIERGTMSKGFVHGTTAVNAEFGVNGRIVSSSDRSAIWPVRVGHHRGELAATDCFV